MTRLPPGRRPGSVPYRDPMRPWRRGPAPQAADDADPDGQGESGEETGTLTQPALTSKVVLFNDEEHTYDYVVEMLTRVCKLAKDAAFRCAVEVDMTGRTVVYYGGREDCEAVCAKILSYGPDHRLPQSMASMQAEVQAY